MNETITTVIKPLPGSPCPHCTFGRRHDGMCSIHTKPDGTIIHTYQPGTLCSTCQGSGRVHITYTPVKL